MKSNTGDNERLIKGIAKPQREINFSFHAVKNAA